MALALKIKQLEYEATVHAYFVSRLRMSAIQLVYKMVGLLEAWSRTEVRNVIDFWVLRIPHQWKFITTL
jgi:hypothetical protein